MKKRLFSLALALILCMGLTVPVSAEKAVSVVWLDENLKPSGNVGIYEGMMGVSKKGAHQCGFVDQTGNIVIPLQYFEVGSFSDGLAAVSAKDEDGFSKWGFIDKTGKMVIPARYEVVNDFSEGVAPVSNGEYWEYIDKTGKTAIPMQFDFARSFNNGIAFVEKDGHEAIIDRTGKFILPIEYGETSFISNDGMFTCRKDGQWWIKNTAGTVSIPLGTKYSSVGGFNNETGLAHVTIGYIPNPLTFGWIDKTGEIAIPTIYTASMYGFTNGLAAVKRGNDGWGYIDKTGKTVIPFGYKDAGTFIDGLAYVAVETDAGLKYGYIDTTGKIVVPTEYDEANFMHNSTAVVKKDGRYGILTIADTPAPAAPTVGGFTDVTTSDYYADSVLWAVEQKITSGTSKTTFSPGVTCSKAQILTFLWHANGSPEPTAATPFTDVKTADYFYKAALWAAEKGLVSGSTFGANTDCTRAMTVEYMWKAAGSPAPAGKADFDDVPANADYAQAVAWAVEKNITSGTGDGNFSPAATCTRGQIVTFLYRAMGK